jgi:YbgC/YbaW family acyl-CoA thioester hydrolase
MNGRTPTDHAVTFESLFRVRSYELDGFGHLNHAVYLNYFEQARFDALAAGGFSIERMSEKGWAVYVVRAEVDFKREARLGQEILVRTRVVEARTSSMTLEHLAVDPTPSGETAADYPADQRSDSVFARGRVVIVWIGPNRAPMRIPPEVRDALGIGSSLGTAETPHGS